MTQPVRRQPFVLSVLLSAMLLSGTALAAVSDQDILQDPKNPEQIVTNGLGVQGQRYSPLDILNIDNVRTCARPGRSPLVVKNNAVSKHSR